ncbi:MAG: hypothetical protein R3A46_07645 [Thermomicrobiales bacterium]
MTEERIKPASPSVMTSTGVDLQRDRFIDRPVFYLLLNAASLISPASSCRRACFR